MWGGRSLQALVHQVFQTGEYAGAAGSKKGLQLSSHSILGRAKVAGQQPADIREQIPLRIRIADQRILMEPEQVDGLRADLVPAYIGKDRIELRAVCDDLLVGFNGTHFFPAEAALGGGITPLTVVIDPFGGNVADTGAMGKVAVSEPQILRGAHPIGKPKIMLPDDIQPIQLVPGEALHPRRQR